jgi:hypothetical protein
MPSISDGDFPLRIEFHKLRLAAMISMWRLMFSLDEFLPGMQVALHLPRLATQIAECDENGANNSQTFSVFRFH